MSPHFAKNITETKNPFFRAQIRMPLSIEERVAALEREAAASTNRAFLFVKPHAGQCLAQRGAQSQ